MKQIKANGKNYFMRLKSRSGIELESELGCTIQTAVGRMDVKTLTTLLYYCLKDVNQGVSLEDTYDIYDAYMEEEHSQSDLILDMIDCFKESGFFTMELAGMLKEELSKAFKPTKESIEESKELVQKVIASKVQKKI